MKTYSSYAGTTTVIGDVQRIINNSAPDNILWGVEQVNDATRYLVTKYYQNERTYLVPGGTVAQTQFYNLPPNVKKLINVTVSIGGVLWQPKECPTKQYWDALNTITFFQDYPSFFFVYNGQVGIWPTPSSSSNILTLNFKTRIVDLSMPDVTNTTSGQTITFSNNSTALLATGAVFLPWMAGQWIRSPFPNGDNQWYQIASVTDTTHAVLDNQYQGATISASPFTIGQVSILPEDYQDLPLYRMGIIYYTTRFPDPARAQIYQKLWDDGFEALNEEFGSKTSSIILSDTDAPIVNPSLFPQSLTGH
jgi:hypothetical protein